MEALRYQLDLARRLTTLCRGSGYLPSEEGIKLALACDTLLLARYECLVGLGGDNWV